MTKTRNKGYKHPYKPQKKTLILLEQVNLVLEEYRAYWPLTCRQIFYRLVGAYGFDKTEGAYGRLLNHLALARRGRVIPFEAIRDDGVSSYAIDHYKDHDHFMRHVRRLGMQYKRDKLASQDIQVEVWCEAAGMLPQLDAIAREYSIKTYSSGGFDSLTTKKDLADRIIAQDKFTYILHLGDYDPSGECIFNSGAEDVRAFVLEDRRWNTIDVEFIRVALTEEQVDIYDLPTAPPKSTDSRTAKWEGEGTCQLEALSPSQISGLLTEAIEDLINLDLVYEEEHQEQADREKIHTLLLPQH